MKYIIQILLFFALLSVSSAEEIGEKFIKNGFIKKSNQPQNVSVSVVTDSEATTLFDEFTRNPSIPFKYPVEGCYARATAMAQIAEKKRIHMGKVFVEGSLQVKTNSKKYPLLNWGWHVAPVLYVRAADKSEQLMVFDPSLFQQPVPVETWKNKMLYMTKDYKPAISHLYYGTRFQYYSKKYDPYKKQWWKEDLDSMEKTFTKFLKLQDFGKDNSKSASHPKNSIKEKSEGAKN